VLWVITVAVFLGTLVAGVLALFLFSQRDRIREALRTPVQRRVESRTRARVEVQLVGTNAPFTNEITLTENVTRCELGWRNLPQAGGKIMTEPLPENQKPVLVIRAPLSEAGLVSIYFSSRDGRMMSWAEWWHLKQLIELTSKMCVKQEAKARAAGA
jgi:hypothetical protein